MSKLYKILAVMVAVSVTLVIGLYIGRSYTIHQAELLETNGDTYYISFGDDVHEYTFEEVE